MKVELMKQNKNTPVVRVASAALAAFVLIFSLCVPSFAVETPSFEDQPIPNTGTTTYREDNYENSTFDVGHNTSGSINYRVFSSTNSHDVYVVGIGSSSPYSIYFLTDNTSSTQIAGIAGKYLSGAGYIGSTSQQTLQLTSIDSFTQFRYYPTGTSIDVVNVPVYSDIAAACLGLQSYLNNAGGTPAHIAVTLKPGYVGYFDISNLSNVSVSLGTSLFSGAKYPGFSTDQAIGTVSSIPSGSFSLPIAGTSSISWAGSGQKDLIGRYSSFSYSRVYTSAGGSTYLVVVNPLSGSAPVLSALGASGANRNGNITVLIDQCRGSKIYSLTESLAIGSGSLDTESNGTSVNDGVYDPDTGAWNFTDPTTGLPEDPSSLPVGGGNDPIIGGTGGNTINEWLEDIANSIKSFFSGAIGAVTTLVSSGSDFIHSLSGLYAWLPGPVYSVLVSALILVITIGVIKVFI